jgi:hypothetical protein
LKINASFYLHDEMYKSIKFLQDKTIPFITWICPVLKQRFVLESEIIYFEGDPIQYINFMKDGSCAFVLPKYENAKYINVTLGYHFGMEDLVGSIIKNDDIHQDDWMGNKDKLIR